jgi:hypothetical protein
LQVGAERHDFSQVWRQWLGIRLVLERVIAFRVVNTSEQWQAFVACSINQLVKTVAHDPSTLTQN